MKTKPSCPFCNNAPEEFQEQDGSLFYRCGPCGVPYLPLAIWDKRWQHHWSPNKDAGYFAMEQMSFLLRVGHELGAKDGDDLNQVILDGMRDALLYRKGLIK